MLGPQNDIVTHRQALHHRDVAAAIETVRASKSGQPAVKLAFEFLVLTAARSAEVRLATWTEINTSDRIWTIPAMRMKASAPDGRWFWINWDMDHSFMDYNQQVPVPWEHDAFRTTLERPGDAPRGWRTSEVRALVLTSLLAEDRAYHAYFKRTFVEVMNHRLTPQFLHERFEYYATLGRQMGGATYCSGTPYIRMCPTTHPHSRSSSSVQASSVPSAVLAPTNRRPREPERSPRGAP